MSLLLLRLPPAFLQQIQDTASLERFREGIPPKPPPIPGGAVTVLRTIFNAPGWLWVIALLAALTAVVVVVRLLWTRRRALRAWVLSRDRTVQAALAAGLFLILAVGAWSGFASWQFMQHDNAFCLGCHIMEGPWNKFALDAGKHSELKCHDCHRQSTYASARQLVLWIAARPEKIPPHAKVPSQRCEECHATEEEETWTRVKETAGHRVHLESDSTVLANVQCVTCHGAAVHAFIPAKETCGQSDCHDQLEIRLGKMAEQTELHCTQCHQFTAEVPRLATRDSAAGTLRPGSPQCLACHEMQRMLVGFDPDREPHRGVCGTCHNPHTQSTPQAAAATCASAQCHIGWEAIPFHGGTAHERVGARCLVCHLPHAGRVDASDCVGCHTQVTSRFGSLRPPLPFDTLRALRPLPPPGSPRRPAATASHPVRGEEAVPERGSPPSSLPAPAPAELSAPRGPAAGYDELEGSSLGPRCASCHERIPTVVPAVADTFSHPRHRRLACLTCHGTGAQHGRLTFEPPRGCQICHHQRPEQADCKACHADMLGATPYPLTIAIAVRDSAPRSRPVSFAHLVHASLRCVQCHTEPVSLAPTTAARTCRDCHQDHHTADRTCETCHKGDALRTAHSKDIPASHQACTACHTGTTVALLLPDRPFCITCHDTRKDHYPAAECSTCHFLRSPAELRPLLMGTTRR